jgi:hypothetical protein
MVEGRPDIPAQMRRDVLVEAGHRCAIPQCRQVPVELAHIVPWSTAKEYTFDNLIALSPTCHTRFDRGDLVDSTGVKVAEFCYPLSHPGWQHAALRLGVSQINAQ